MRDLITKYHAMWDGSEDWGLVQHNVGLVKLQITFSGNKPNVKELVAIRTLLPSYFEHLTPTELRARIGASNTVILVVRSDWFWNYSNSRLCVCHQPAKSKFYKIYLI